MNLVMVLMLGLCVFLWYAVFTIGFFHTLFWVVMGSITGGLMIKLKEWIND